MIAEDYTSVEIAAALVKMAMNRENYNENVNSSSEEFGDTGARPNMVRFFMNVGRKDKAKARDIIKAIADKTGLSSSVIGKVDVYDKFSFVEIPENSAKDVL